MKRGTSAAAAPTTLPPTSTHRTSLTAQENTSHTTSGLTATSVGHAIGNGRERTGFGTTKKGGSCRRGVANHPIVVGAAPGPKTLALVAVNKALALVAANTLREPRRLPAMFANKMMITGQCWAKTMVS